MRNVVLEEVKNELNFKEKIVVKVFAKTFEKVYNITRISISNEFFK